MDTGASGVPQETYRVNLAHVQVAGIAESQDGGYVVTLDYAQIGVITHPIQANGAAGPAQQFGYDQVFNTTISPPANVAAATSAATVAPTQFLRRHRRHETAARTTPTTRAGSRSTSSTSTPSTA